MRGEKIQVSVIVPVYNVEKYLAECLDSLCQQKNITFEVICINDGSKDNSMSILEDYAQMYNFISVYSQENKGLSAARNAGMRHAVGKYVYFLDSDDMLADELVLSEIVSIFERTDVDVISVDAESFYEDEQIENKLPHYKNAYKSSGEYGRYKSGKELFIDLWKKKEYYPSVCTYFYKRSFLDKYHITFYEGILYEDNVFTLNVLLAAESAFHTNIVCMKRRVHYGSIMTSEPTFKNFYSYVLLYIEVKMIWSNHQDNCLEPFFKCLCNNFKNSARQLYINLKDIQKKELFALSGYLRYCIENEILVKNVGKQCYEFPYHLFDKYDRCIIYGAGNVGKSFYRLAKTDGIVEIIGIVDAKGKACSELDFEVKEIDFIREHIGEKILIAIENEDIANSVAIYLRELGVDTANILWDGSRYSRKNNVKIMQELDYIKFDYTKYKKRAFCFMQPEHGNLGDYLISMGERNFFNQYLCEYDVKWITTNDWQEMKKVFVENINDSDILFINGGGYFGDLWNSGSICKDIISTFPNNKIIAFPNTLTYKDRLWDNQVLERDIIFLNSHKNLCTFWRDIGSYYQLEKKLSIACNYAPDMALMKKYPRKTIGDGSVMLCLREDKEKMVDIRQAVKQILDEAEIDYCEKDIHLGKFTPLLEGYRMAEEMVKEMQCKSLIITDRLHAMIMATISGVPCVAFDNTTKKVSGVYPWIKSNTTVFCEDIEYFDIGMINKLMNTREFNYIQPDYEFSLMAEKIKYFVGV